MTPAAYTMKTCQPELPLPQNCLTEQAAAWFLRMQEGDCSDAERQEFETWLAASPTHRDEYQQYVQLWRNLDQIGGVTIPSRRRKERAGIALVALVTILGAMQWVASREETFTTALGEQQQIVLADGTTVDMNTTTVLRVAMSGFTRKVTLEQGEALFNVAHSALRPFEVHAGSGTLRDIGTSFNVVREGEKTTVAVLEGEVQVSLDNADSVAAVTLHGGEQLAYSAHELSAVSVADAKAATAWREGRIIFRDTPLAEVIDQINRYHPRQIVLTDAGLGDLKVSGEFNTADREGLIQALKTRFPLISAERGDVTALSQMHAD